MVTSCKKQVQRLLLRMVEMRKSRTVRAADKATLALWSAALKCEHMYECMYCICEYIYLGFKFTENKRTVNLTK